MNLHSVDILCHSFVVPFAISRLTRSILTRSPFAAPRATHRFSVGSTSRYSMPIERPEENDDQDAIGDSG